MMQPFILMEQYRSSLTPRTQRRSQNICSDTAKIQTLFETTKFWSSKCREKLVFPLLSRDKIRPKVKFFLIFFSKTTCFRGESSLQTTRLNATFTQFGAFKLRKLFIHLRKTPNNLTQQGSNHDAQVVSDVLGC